VEGKGGEGRGGEGTLVEDGEGRNRRERERECTRARVCVWGGGTFAYIHVASDAAHAKV